MVYTFVDPMSKNLSTTVIATMMCSILAAIVTNQSVRAIPAAIDIQDKLIVKSVKAPHPNVLQQSDLDGIHRTLTQFYSGMNEYNLDRMARASVSVSSSEREYIKRMFGRLKAALVDLSFEIKNIELVSMYRDTAVVNIYQLMSIRGPNGAGSSQQSAVVTLVKQSGRWKIAKNNTIIKSLNRE